MKTVGRFAFAFLLFLVLIPALFISACGDDDDDDRGGSLPPGDDDLSDDEADDDVADDDTQAGDDDDDTDDDSDDDGDDDLDDDVDDDADDDVQNCADDYADGYGLTWKCIPAGIFEMGCSINDHSCSAWEKPRHTVTLTTDFWMTETEITQAQFELVMGYNPSDYAGCPDCPVEMVTWFEATDFCETVGGGLPTEAQWEYAARAGTETMWYCGDDWQCTYGIAWTALNSDGHPHPVATRNPNDFGLYDMSGNVREWCSDWFEHFYYEEEPEGGWIDPQGPNTSSTDSRVIRSGGWDSMNDTISSYRTGLGPEDTVTELGFRCQGTYWLRIQR